ncbi:cytosine permease [Brevibacterium sp. 5221]|uniref:Cytosine permease n=1 Tax=Brevibacterium rongguiense TaxID=2695267 RepID=A0A6N9H623_9MICO|nr:cytosine permease [Brevibacterium rongguiense]MYM19311.1 cytosine permease [Brevibacterium rongguiense]
MPSPLLTPETRSIEFVPLTERHGSPRSLFTLWFGANLQVTSIAAGALTVTVGLSLPWALLATIIGTLVGAVFMALHSAQGPILGVPQMIQSRAQFGYVGAVLPLVLVVLMYLGYFSTTAVQGGAALASLTHLDISAAIVVIIAVIVVVAVLGYPLIHAAQKLLSILSGAAFLILTVCLLLNNDVAAVWTFDEFAWGPFVLAIAIGATWQLTYAPYVADYSRYLPPETSVAKSFWFSYAGTTIATIWMFGFGAVATAVAADAFEGGSVDFIVGQAPFGHAAFYLIIIAGVIGIDALNLYGLFMSATTILNSLFRFRVTPAVRLSIIVVGAAVACAVSLVGRENFLANFTNFILLLAYFLIPWTSINLADFYLVRRERYNIRALFDPAGEYGGIDWRTMLAYGIGIAVEVPFISSDFYTGPLAQAFDGADISWILGIFAAAVPYVALMHWFPMRRGFPPVSTGAEAVAEEASHLPSAR